MSKMYEKDPLGTRMKQYEIDVRQYLPSKAYTVLRLDGKAFHTYTKGLKRPFDMDLIEDMDNTAKYLCENIQGCKLGYVQSDEITLVLTDFDKEETSSWYNGEVQKMVSVASGLATSKFNHLRTLRIVKDFELDYGDQSPNEIAEQSYMDLVEIIENMKLAEFDARCWSIPREDVWEVWNNLIWRVQDCRRNSVSSVGQSMYSANQLHKVTTKQLIEKLKDEKDYDWNDLDDSLKNGRLIVKEKVSDSRYVNGETIFFERSRWTSVGCKLLSEDKSQIEFLKDIGK